MLVSPGKNKYPINGLLPLSNKFLASKLTKFQFQIFIHLIPVTIYRYILQVFKISLSNVSKFWFFCKPFKLYMYIWSTKIVWRIFLSLLMECIVHNILLILIMRIQILLSSFLNTAKNSNVNSIYLFPIYKYANNVI